ncbi:ArsR/SmtB family transcription factor [Streptomyces hygroscopicus]|nr:metalloregulator ArsR/SmtB family transcription factor [Streptomyces hygroscopicus]
MTTQRRRLSHRPQSSESTVITVSTAVEMVCRLYVAAHAMTGDFEQVPASAAGTVPLDDETHDLLLRYFQADYAVGTGLVRTAVTRGWDTEDQLITGVAAMTPRELVFEILASTTLEPKGRTATTKLVEQGLTEPDARRSAASKIARRNSYSRADVESTLAEPERVHAEITHLLSKCHLGADAEQAAAKRLANLAEAVSELISVESRERALLKVTGGWTVKDDADPVVLVPTEALGSFVLPRLLDDGRMLVVFGPLRDRDRPLTLADAAEIARALGNEQRLAILRHISEEPASGQTLARALGLTGATVHYHTSLLRSLGLITSARDAHSIVHSLDSHHLLTATAAIANAVLGKDSVMVATST